MKRFFLPLFFAVHFAVCGQTAIGINKIVDKLVSERYIGYSSTVYVFEIKSLYIDMSDTISKVTSIHTSDFLENILKQKDTVLTVSLEPIDTLETSESKTFFCRLSFAYSNIYSESNRVLLNHGSVLVCIKLKDDLWFVDEIIYQ